MAQLNEKVEKALRGALGSVSHAEVDQITAPLAVLDDSERTKALALAIVITCYVGVDACGSLWPTPASVRRIARTLSTGTATAVQLNLDPEEIHAYLSRVVFGSDRLEDIISDEPQSTRLPLIVAVQALAVYCPKELGIWDYLDQIESALEVVSSLPSAVLPAAVMLAYLPRRDTGDDA